MKFTPDNVVPFDRSRPILRATSDVMIDAYHRGMQMAEADSSFLKKVAQTVCLDRPNISAPVQQTIVFGSALGGPIIYNLVNLVAAKGPQMLGDTLAIAGGIAVDGAEPELAAKANAFMEQVGVRPSREGELQANYMYEVFHDLAVAKGIEMPELMIISKSCINSAENTQAIINRNFGRNVYHLPVQAIGVHGQAYHAHWRGPATLRKNMRGMMNLSQDELPTLVTYGTSLPGMTADNFHTFEPVIAGAVFAEYFRFNGGLNGEKPHMEQGHFDAEDLHSPAQNIADIQRLDPQPVRMARLARRASQPRVLVA